MEIGAYNRSIANANGGPVGHEVNRPMQEPENMPGNRMPDVYANVNGMCSDPGLDLETGLMPTLMACF